ncbi:MAG: DNA/RNA nuclease SfsA [Deltaproteobacteria bacterium]|nr:MAG: DNA/RNA nuclease SfsA [Deltaproteobacteria bacterium]
MEFGPLIEGRLLRRYKRFLADVELCDGQVVVAHCANPGSMATCSPPGARVWLSRADNPARKLRYTWELVEVDGALVCVNPVRANDLVAEAIERAVVRELAGYRTLRREVRRNGSRFDLRLEGGGAPCWVEVKSATLAVGPGVVAFPDAVTARGARHARELADAAAAGDRAVLLFSCARSDAQRLRPADHVDPEYGRALRDAVAAGVEVLAYRGAIDLRGMRLVERVPVDL